MIADKILSLRQELASHCGSIIRITLDKEGNRALRNELIVPFDACKGKLFGIIIDQVEDCPTCGQALSTENEK